MSDRVLLLHGIMRSAASMRRMERALAAAGYHTLNLGYPARRLPLEALAKTVRHAAGAFLGPHAGRTHIVAHSLGALVARVLIDQHRPPGLGHVVMLGPPNGGSELADRLGSLAFYRWTFGPAGDQLATRRDQALLTLLGPTSCPVGVIAGTRARPARVAATAPPQRRARRRSAHPPDGHDRPPSAAGHPHPDDAQSHRDRPDAALP